MNGYACSPNIESASRRFEFRKKGREVIRNDAINGDSAACESACDEISSRFNPIRDGFHIGRMQVIHPFDLEFACANPLDPRSHSNKEAGESCYLRFNGGVFNACGAAGEHGRHQHVARGANTGDVEVDARAHQPIRPGFDVAAIHFHAGAKFSYSFKVEIHRAGTPCTPPRK